MEIAVLDTPAHLSVSEPNKEFDFVRGMIIGEEFTGTPAIIYLEAYDGTELRVQKDHETLATLPIKSGQSFYLS